MSDINIRIGGDNSDYRRVLNESEVSSAEFNKRVAAQTAAVLGAESRLAEMRGRNDTLRAAGFNKDIFLQREILSLKSEISAMEEGSLAQTEKKIVLEEKVLQLEQVIASQKVESSAAVATQNAGLVDATAKAVTLKEAFKSMGVTIKGAGIGVAFAALIAGAKESINQATALRDKLRETGAPIDGATRSMASFGDGLKGVKQFGIDAVGFLIGGFTQLGDLIGSTINRVRGISEAEENRMAAIADETERALARIAAAKQKFQEENTPEKMAEREKEALAKRIEQWEAYLDEVGKKQKTADDQSRDRRQKNFDLQQQADEAHLQAVADNIEMLRLEAKAVSGLTADETKRLEVLKLITKQREIEEQITTLLSLNKRTPAEEKQLQLLISQSDEITKQINLLNNGVVPAVEAVVDAEKKVTAEKKKQYDIAVKQTGRGDQELSDRELQRKITNISRDIAARSAGLLGGWGGPTALGSLQDGMIAPQSIERNQARAELDFRSQVRRVAANQGEGAAFSQFPGLSEQRLREILQTAPGTRDVVDELKTLNGQLKRGIPTVLFGTDEGGA